MTRMLVALLVLACTALFTPASFAAAGDETLAILPGDFTLAGPYARQTLLLQRVQDQEYLGTPAGDITWTSSNPDVVAIEDGVAAAVGNGTAVITATVEGGEGSGTAKAQTKVTVTGVDVPHTWSFRHHVLPVLSRYGCNSGACHGAMAGKGGFRLSLRGYDPAGDYHNITRQAQGRRVELADPGRSLILAKPSGGLPHKGGVRFEVDSPDYHVIAQWIASGAAGPANDDPQLQRVEVLPPQMLLRPGTRQPLVVRAHYSDGRMEDVTRWAKFTSANEAVAQVDEAGNVNVIGHGEGAVTVWFSSQIAIARVTSPYPHQIDPAVFAQAPRHNFIDDLVLEQLQRLNLPPSPPATDAEFLRRVYLDTIGTLPPTEVVRSFLADDTLDKRQRLIDSLLARPEFVDYWSYRWSDLLLINGTRLRPDAVKAYHNWIHGHVAANTPWDKFAREVILAKGSSFENGATNFYALHQDPESLTENVSQAFLGLSIACAKCHNHPLEKWTNDQYYAMANLFARVRFKGWGGDPRNGSGLLTLYVVPRGDLIQPLTGKPQPPTPLDGEPIALDDPGDRREHLARWLTSPDNPYFARAITNRVWANFFGVGLVEPVDDLRASNPASNERLLTAAADYLVEKNFDLKELMRAILTSATYQRSSKPLPENRDEQRYYSRYYPKRLMAEVLLDAVSQVTGVASNFTEIEYPGADRRKIDFYPPGTRAIQLYDSAVSSYFLRTFGRNQREITCECERSDEPSMVQVLHISNGDTINEKLQTQGSRVEQLLKDGLAHAEMVEQVYLSALARYPTDQERERLVALMGQAVQDDAVAGSAKPKSEPSKGSKEPAPAWTAAERTAVEDLFWAVLSSREFLFNH